MEYGENMKLRKLEEKWLCQLCGKVNDEPQHHVNTHRHKMNLKKIEDAMSGEPIRQIVKDARWLGR